jgi:hypothetical protein
MFTTLAKPENDQLIAQVNAWAWDELKGFGR